MSLDGNTFAIHWKECSIVSININTVGLKNILLLKILKLHHLPT